MPTQLVRLCLGVSLALVTSLPGTSSASSIASTFKSSSNGTTTLAVSDTIQFEVSITLDAGQAFDTVFFSVTGDVVGAIGSSPASGWAGVQNIVTDWEWHYSAGNKVDMGTNGVLVPFPPPFSPPSPVVGPYGFGAQGGKTGDGIPSLVGTVTILVNNGGVYQTGGFLYPTVDAFVSLGRRGIHGYHDLKRIPSYLIGNRLRDQQSVRLECHRDAKNPADLEKELDTCFVCERLATLKLHFLYSRKVNSFEKDLIAEDARTNDTICPLITHDAAYIAELMVLDVYFSMWHVIRERQFLRPSGLFLLTGEHDTGAMTRQVRSHSPIAH